jgi:hypothetical protein
MTAKPSNDKPSKKRRHDDDDARSKESKSRKHDKARDKDKLSKQDKKAQKKAKESHLLSQIPTHDPDGIPYNKIQIRRMKRRVKHGLNPIPTEEEDREIQKRVEEEKRWRNCLPIVLRRRRRIMLMMTAAMKRMAKMMEIQKKRNKTTIPSITNQLKQNQSTKRPVPNQSHPTTSAPLVKTNVPILHPIGYTIVLRKLLKRDVIPNLKRFGGCTILPLVKSLLADCHLMLRSVE